MKKYISVILACAMIVSATGCSSGEEVRIAPRDEVTNGLDHSEAAVGAGAADSGLSVKGDHAAGDYDAEDFAAVDGGYEYEYFGDTAAADSYVSEGRSSDRIIEYPEHQPPA